MVRKFTEQGQEVEIVQKLSDGRFLVAYVMEYGYDGEEYVSEDPVVVDRVFDCAPTCKLDARVDKLTSEIVDLTRKRSELTKELREAAAQHEEHMAKYTKYAGLEQLDKFIDGKITHYVIDIQWSSPEIKTFEEMVGDYDGKAPRLLSLFGSSEGSLDWRLNRYRDDSGSWRKCIPCLSYEEAVEKLAGVMYEKMEEYVSQGTLEICDRYGIDVPEDYRAQVEKKRRDSVEEAIEKTRQKLAELEAKL
jgi:hypothetical protein